ncbi:hypothetical protein IFM89_017557 [Coptis chinensis]|uniref:Peptidase A1 domain-containing protein n=1 Tax=Coptis chinensis TaxID=261450 RepID=A0A835HWB1_9MAGN|nr:hypothetical protein IFM89_017557 [Coptis chinensis]
MASSMHFLFFSSLLISISLSTPQILNGHDAIVLPILKDSRTLQYVTHAYQGTPAIPKKLVIDLGGQYIWIDRGSGDVSSTYRPAQCRSIQCSTANANNCGTSFTSHKAEFEKINTCGLLVKNGITGMIMNVELGEDIITVQSTTSPAFRSMASIDNFLFSRAPPFLLQGLASGAKGVLGLGMSRISLPSQVAGVFSINRKFTICLPSSSKSKGVIFFDTSGPYIRSNDVMRKTKTLSLSTTLSEISKSLIYTPLIANPMKKGTASTQDHFNEYYIGVKSISIHGKPLLLQTLLLSINNDGTGGAKLSTIIPYTTLETSIYNTFTKGFMEVAASLFNMTRVASVAPFEVCFNSENIVNTRSGPIVPTIELVLQKQSGEVEDIWG